MSFVHKLTATRAEYIHKFTFRKAGRRFFGYLLVKRDKQAEFQKKLAAKEQVSLAHYGEVLGECEGSVPTESLIQRMMERYGFTREQLLPAS